MKKLVSVILPVYNSKKFVLQALNSIINQTYQNIEIIIIDDCSTDGSFQFLKKFDKNNNKIKLYQTKKNSGTVAAPRNLGVKKAKGDIICFIDSDDIWEIDKIEKQIKFFKNNKTIITSAASYFSKENKKSSIIINVLRRLIQLFIIKKINLKGFQWFYLYNPIIVSSVMMYKEILNKNSFDESINAREDIDLWIRLRKKNYNFKLVNKILVKIRRRDDSMSSNIQKELITIIGSLSNVFLKLNTFKKLNFFLFGIFIKFFLAFIKQNKKRILKFFKISTLSFIIFSFLIFYSPLFWHLGSPLLYFDDINLKNKNSNLVVFSGHGSTSYYNITYRYRYRDIINLSNKIGNIENIFILGRVQEIPEQKILESLLISHGIKKDKIKLIYDDYKNTSNNIDNIYKIIKKKNINEIIFVTSPYHSKRSKLLWSNFNDLKVLFWKGYEWPEKNSLFEYSLNKKIIIYEHLSIFYNKLKGNIN